MKYLFLFILVSYAALAGYTQEISGTISNVQNRQLIRELKEAVQKVVVRNAQKKQNHQLENLIRIMEKNQEKKDHRIALASSKEVRFIPTEQIVRCISSNNYTTFHLSNSEVIVASRPIYEYEELLADYGFIRCHQSHLVNRKYIKSFVKELGGYLVTDDGSEIPVSRQRKDYVRSILAL